MNNIFQRLGCSFPGEDFFTAALALFVERNPALRNAILTWLEEACGERLQGYAWQVEIQHSSASCAGEAVLDMKLRHPDIELWFEHKVDAPLGRRRSSTGRDLDQLEKYLDAAARIMNGVGTGTDDIDWPVAPVAGQPRVLLFYVSRAGVVPARERYAGRLHAAGGYGLVWPTSGPLRWRDFWPRAVVALDPVLAGDAGEFERTLTRQFVSYWQSLRGMWSHDASSDWCELLTKADDGRFPIEPLWDGVCRLASESLGWTYKGGYLGNTLQYEPPAGAIDQITVWAEASRDQLAVDTQGLPEEIIHLQFRLRDSTLSLPPAGQRLAFERWRGVTGLGKPKGRICLRIFVGVTDWEAALTQEQRTKAITAAFVAGIKMFNQTTRSTLAGTERL